VNKDYHKSHKGWHLLQTVKKTEVKAVRGNTQKCL